MTTVSDITTPPASGLAHVDALLDVGPGWNWLTPTRDTLYYTFSLAPDSPSKISGAPSAFNAAQRSAAISALAVLSEITGIMFIATGEDSVADIHFATGDIIDASIAGFCQTSWRYSQLDGMITNYSADAHVYLDNANFATINNSPTVANGGVEILLHELGHAMGLKHPFQGDVKLPAAQENTAYTLMSYTHIGGPYATYSPFDIAALRWLYGGDGLGGALGQGTTGRYLVGTDGNDSLVGGDGGDVFEGLDGNDTIKGGLGIDRAIFAAPRANYAVDRLGDTITVQALVGKGGFDTLTLVERLQFGDQSLAFDLDGNAGITAKLLAAVFSKESLANAQLVGIGLKLLDTGTTPSDLMQLALAARLGPGFSPSAEVTVLYENLTGQAPSQSDLQFWTDALAAGKYTPTSLALMATEHELNLQHVNLIGLAQSGIEFT